ncbi:MAG: DUF3570 domain-containing protein [Calditrichia bacterium]
MQLSRISLLLFLLGAVAFAQTDMARDTEIDFLFNYYSQDGDNAAVTGGQGTEELTDVGPLIVVTIPMRDTHSLAVTTGLEVYTSASSDNVDPVVSGASGQDARAYVNLGYTIGSQDGTGSYGLLLGGSAEYDYNSVSFGATWSKGSQDGNRELSLKSQFFFDNATIIRPIELRSSLRGENVSGARRTFSSSATWSQVINQRMQAALNVDFAYQTGFLSTPFHRVYFPGENLPRTELLPESRIKIPVGLRLNTYINEYLVTRLFYRFYYDDFGITANTFSAELPIRFVKSFAVTPFVRYHNQTEADYFADFEQHDPSSEFYTSDFDLSGFNSLKYGLGFRYYPLERIAKMGNLNLKKMEFRVALYDRSDGLTAFTTTLGLSFYLR